MATLLPGVWTERDVRPRAEAETILAASTPAGLRILLPGYAQWAWRQRERGLVFFGSFAAAVFVAAFAWGTPTGLVVLAFAFGTHVFSAVDAVRQSTFPATGRLPTLVGVSGGLAAGVYGPVLVVASLAAWPGMQGGSEPEGYLVNRWAYRSAEPKVDDWVWYISAPKGEPRAGRVVAGRGQDVEWSERQLRVDGEETSVKIPFRSSWPPRSLSYRVPEGHVLIAPKGTASAQKLWEGLVIVPRERVLGRIWAKAYPLRERQLLP